MKIIYASSLKSLKQSKDVYQTNIQKNFALK